jgi:ATP synthase protein I
MSSDPGDREDHAGLRARLDRLSGELKGRPAPQPKSAPKADSTGSAMSLGMRAASEFVSAILVGLGIGWALDRALGTNPAFLIVFFMIGVAAGVWNVIRLTSPKGGSFNRDSPLSRADSPDKERDASLGGRGAASGALKPRDGADDNED